jgi:hypothetical protein
MIKRILITVLAISLSQAAFTAAPIYSSLTYNIGLPVENTADFINQNSWVGVGLQARRMLNPYLSTGVYVGWNYFKDAGNQDRSRHIVPLLLDSHLYLGQPGFRPFIGIGIGPYYIYTRRVPAGGASTSHTWHFGISPEFGIAVRGMPHAGLVISGRFHYAFAAGGLPDQSFWTVQIGGYWAGW